MKIGRNLQSVLIAVALFFGLIAFSAVVVYPLFKNMVEKKKELEKKSKLLSKEAKEKKAKEFFEKKKAWEQFTLQSKMKLSRLSNKMSTPIIEDILAIAKKIGEKEGYTVIFEVQRAGIAYAPAKLDITDKIVKELDKKAGKR